MKNYQALQKIIKKVKKLHNVLSILSWDSNVMMPKKSAPSRAEEIALVTSIAHEEFASKRVAELIENIEASELSLLNEIEKREIQLIKHSYIHSSCISPDLVSSFSKSTSNCEMIWRDARANNDYKALLPHLSEVVKLKKEIAAVKAGVFGKSKYNALLDEYEPGQTTDDIDSVFNSVKAFLPKLIDEIISKQKSSKPIPIVGHFSIEKQKDLGILIMKKMGFDFDMGRLDISKHPFCGGTQFDIRMTTRYREDDFLSSLMGIIHETGHALYNMNLPEKYSSMLVGSYLGMSLHESQSLIMEMQAAASKEFLHYLSKVVEETFGEGKPEFSSENLYKTINRVQKTLIRVDSDEVTYPMHVIMRYELEKEIIDSDFDMKDLPEAWNDKMQQYLGIIPKDDKDGCMQDVHWMWGAFGYFPSYLYGAIIASNLMHAAKQKYPNISRELHNGEFTSLNEFLNKNVRTYGSTYTLDDLIRKSTGRDLSVDIYKSYLEQKYFS